MVSFLAPRSLKGCASPPLPTTPLGGGIVLELDQAAGSVACMYCKAAIPSCAFAFWSGAHVLVSATCPVCLRKVTLPLAAWRRGQLLPAPAAPVARTRTAHAQALAAAVQASTTSSRQESVTLACEPQSASAARRFVTQMCGGSMSDDELGTATLLVSELVTNVVVHAGTACRLTVSLDASSVYVEVQDGNRDPVSDVVAARDETGGRGLLLVELLSTRWGVVTTPRGKYVWFALETAAVDHDGTAVAAWTPA